MCSNNSRQPELNRLIIICYEKGGPTNYRRHVVARWMRGNEAVLLLSVCDVGPAALDLKIVQSSSCIPVSLIALLHESVYVCLSPWFVCTQCTVLVQGCQLLGGGYR